MHALRAAVHAPTDIFYLKTKVLSNSLSHLILASSLSETPSHYDSHLADGHNKVVRLRDKHPGMSAVDWVGVFVQPASPFLSIHSHSPAENACSVYNTLACLIFFVTQDCH